MNIDQKASCEVDAVVRVICNYSTKTVLIFTCIFIHGNDNKDGKIQNKDSESVFP